MNWKIFLSIVAVTVLMTVFEWPKISPRKEKWAFAAMTGIGAVFATIIAAYPGLPNPDQFVEILYRPISSLLGD